MLIIPYSHVAEKYGEEETGKLFLYGQERNPEIYAVCQMNLLLHDIKNANIANGDTLDYPRFTEDGKLKKFDVVIANVPWNQDGYGEERLKKADFRERFYFGFSPQNSADWAWIQHMLASAKENGRVGIVVDNGCLFRGGPERSIRSKVVEKDWIECVILTPEKLFYNTGAPGAIIIFRKNKPRERRNKILFINASNEYIPHPSVRRLNTLSKENIDKIVEAYRKFTDTSGFSRVVDVSEVRKNDFNLNVTLYVMPVEKKEQIDVSKEFQELIKIEEERKKITEDLKKILEQIKGAI
jgi:type I restriction enzyme M protein